MSKINGVARILRRPTEVSAFVPDVISAADGAREALGFFSRSVYPEFCRKGQLFVASVRADDSDVYAGHLLFDLTFPKAHVRQIHVAPAFRGHKLGTKLLDALKDMVTDLQYIAINARVAEELTLANAFWESQGFYGQRVVPGGTTRKRMIVVRTHELSTPQLFATTGITAADPLGLEVSAGGSKPLFLLDLNVLFDLGPRRARHELVMDVFRAERMQSCSLAVSEEIDVELRRTARDPKTDPMRAFAATLPKFPEPPKLVWDELSRELANLVFPDRRDSLASNDLSDLKHLATAIHHGLPGLVTSDDRILDSAAELRQRFGLEVLSPGFFQADRDHHDSTAAHETPTSEVVSLEPAESGDTSDIQRLLRGLGIDASSQVREWAATDAAGNACSRLVARCNRQVVGYLVWPADVLGPSSIGAHVAVSEDCPSVQAVASAILRHLKDLFKAGDVGLIRLSLAPRQADFREVAASFGYSRSAARPNDLQRIVVKRRLTPTSWSQAQLLIAASANLHLPKSAPAFRHVNQHIEVVRPDGQKALVPLFRLETLLAPALFCLPGRSGVLVPVQRQFEEHLLDESPQESFLPRNKAQLSPQRHYVSDGQNLKVLSQGDLLFFYESSRGKGARAVTALGRVVRAYHRLEAALSEEDFASSVLTVELLSRIGTSKKKTVMVFDNLMRLPRAVPLEELRSIQCGEAHQLQKTQRLTARQVSTLLEMGGLA